MGELTTDPKDPRLTRGVDEEPVEQAEVYLVMSDADKARGFTRPYRTLYVHAENLGGCGAVTHMSQSLSQTYAADPSFYGATFCVGCSKHRPVGENGEFYWDGTSIKVGT